MLKKYNDGRMYLNGCQLLGEWGKIKAEEKNRLEYFCDAFDEYYGLLDRMYAIANHKFLYEKSGYKVYATRIAEFFENEGEVYCTPHEEIILTDGSNDLRYRVVNKTMAESLVLNFSRIDDRRPIAIYEQNHIQKVDLNSVLDRLENERIEQTQDM